jgi:putative restriction endonuclease
MVSWRNDQTVREVHDYRCAILDLRLRNGGGRPEVQAAHIRPVERQGSDHTILVSRNKVPSDVVDRLILPHGKLCLPNAGRDWPHPENLRWHRENVFGQMIDDDPLPWG